MAGVLMDAAMQTFDPFSLRLFIAVCEERNITAAAGAKRSCRRR
jgi:hypothetical protein